MLKIGLCLLGVIFITWACVLPQPGSALVTSSTGAPETGAASQSLSPTTPSAGKALLTPTLEGSPAATGAIPASTAVASETPQVSTPVPAATRPSRPIVAAAYPIAYPGSSLGLGGILAASPGRVWVAGIYLETAAPAAPLPGIQEWDADSGKVLHAFPLPQIIRFFDMKYDGQTLWVLASKKEAAYADTLYAIGLPDGQVVKEWDGFNEGEFGWSPTHLGLSPGKIWVANKVIDTQSLQELTLGASFVLPSEAHFGYDGQQWMWITGGRCEGCNHALWLFDANDPKIIKDEGGTGAPDEGTGGEPIVQANGKMWLGAVNDIKIVNNLFSGTPYLEAYDLNQNSQPSLRVDVTQELAGWESIGLLVVDNHVVWLGNPFASTTLYYHDQNTGQLLGSLQLDTPGIADVAFDGKNLWILDADDLVRVALPWEP